MKTVLDLVAEPCGHGHESLWRLHGNTWETIKKVKNCIRQCVSAKNGLNSGCAHAGFHEHDSNTIFERGLTGYSEEKKKKMVKKWDFFGQIKYRIDQLYRWGNGGNLDAALGDFDLISTPTSEGEDPESALSIYSLKRNDPLRLLLISAGDLASQKIFTSEYWLLLGEAEKMLVARKGLLLHAVKRNFRIQNQTKKTLKTETRI